MNILRIVVRGLAAGAGLMLLAVCAHAPSGKVDDSARFVSAEYDMAMIYPASLKASIGFETNYFLQTRWNPDAAANVSGRGLLTLTLPESNKLITGTLRLGASNNPHAVAECALPAGGHAGRCRALSSPV